MHCCQTEVASTNLGHQAAALPFCQAPAAKKKQPGEIRMQKACRTPLLWGSLTVCGLGGSKKHLVEVMGFSIEPPKRDRFVARSGTRPAQGSLSWPGVAGVG